MSLQTVFSGILSSDSCGFLWETIGWIKHTFLGVIGHMNEGGVGGFDFAALGPYRSRIIVNTSIVGILSSNHYFKSGHFYISAFTFLLLHACLPPI